ncbi:prophage protein [Yersinia pestis INS]|uniref:Prophage protein n=1 Tax=Yersinia pestis TaxID=632 RepID=Q0WHV7_YERPE|nr:prophage protein [Yersinia pestis INS]CAL19754.1 putative prophage protein [Yersinia pestis CO92]
MMKTIKHYLTPEGRDLYMEYLKSLRDSIAKAKISSRVNRIASGNFGDHKPCREGVWELRIDQGPGYRVYYSLVAVKSCCCFWAVISARRMPTSIRLLCVLKII